MQSSCGLGILFSCVVDGLVAIINRVAGVFVQLVMATAEGATLRLDSRWILAFTLIAAAIIAIVINGHRRRNIACASMSPSSSKRNRGIAIRQTAPLQPQHQTPVAAMEPNQQHPLSPSSAGCLSTRTLERSGSNVPQENTGASVSHSSHQTSTSTVTARDSGVAALSNAHTWTDQPWAFKEGSIHFELGDLIAGGAFGAVHNATLLAQDVVAKTHHALINPRLYGLDDPAHLNTVLQEIMSEIMPLRNLRHRRIVGFIGVVYGQVAGMGSLDVPKHLLMEKIEGGTLHDSMYQQDGQPKLRLPAETILRYAQELAEAVEYIHGQGFIHRDIKPKNILLTAEDGHIKLADLGLAKVVEHTTRGNTKCGSPIYMAPEIATGMYSNKVDVYSTALVMCETILREVPGTDSARRERLVERAIAQHPELSLALRGGLAPVVGRMDSATFLREISIARGTMVSASENIMLRFLNPSNVSIP